MNVDYYECQVTVGFVAACMIDIVAEVEIGFADMSTSDLGLEEWDDSIYSEGCFQSS